ncbi:hypothetical protein [Nodularia sphaerocarpa]|uniref:hypothetical protein n=1 Tax=Nodularia sphaerocarpa TaxID=137816 RepID=UPI001EFA9229|nr:hypothetical protein [Nodularia sphaerocarpa]MDB9371825.1 hypothetical protein [Nodularia sphaerocarpa CS-585]MDB9376476.1 hypothetical protein [Nodularia sphaerocarpa CS-585A2]ULP74187.1 hypothetical protein BDGGKGIB_03850 [Nodularia sphaerocarpa UHCC 0038]
MKKQQLSLSLALGLTLFSCLVGAPMRANAGGTPVTGGSFSNFIGNIRNNISNVTGFGGGSFVVPPRIQFNLNLAANKILEEYQDVNMLFAVVQNKSLLENGESPIVDINMLNAAIVDYNNTVMESSPEELEKLAKDPDFIRTGKMLKELRAVLNES